MANNKPKTVLYRRKRELRTDYNKRLKLLASRKPRLAIRFTGHKIIGQIIEFSAKGDLVKAGVSSDLLSKKGWKASPKNVPAAYLTGFWLAKKAVHAGITEAILDTGLKTPERKGKIYAFLKGAIDGGLLIPQGEEDIFPSLEVILGQHLKTTVKEHFSKVKQSLGN